MSQLREHFRATAENVAQDAQEIRKIEDEKSGLDSADPRAASLSAKVEELAGQLYQISLAERDLVETASRTS